MKEVIFVILEGFADWEGAYIATCLNQGVKPGNPISYKVKTLSITKEPVSSIGGFKVLPDYGLNDMPENYAGLVLIGGMNWFSPLGELIVPLVEKAVKENKLVAGICNASVFLGMHGFLNEVKHTSNTLDYLKQYAGDKYTGDSNYINKGRKYCNCQRNRATGILQGNIICIRSGYNRCDRRKLSVLQKWILPGDIKRMKE